jgi:PhnB protein
MWTVLCILEENMIVPFINFNGNCNDAIDFYEKIFTVKNKMIQKWGDMEGIPENMFDKIVHAIMEMDEQKFYLGDSLDEVTAGSMISIRVTYSNPEKVTEVFNKLAKGGDIILECSPKVYNKMHGCVKDKFGIIWQILVE